MTPPARGYIRFCSSALVPLVLLVMLWPQHDRRTAAHLEAARRAKYGVVPAIPQELPDGVHLAVLKPKPAPAPRAKPQPKPAPHIAWPGIPQEQLAKLGTRSVFSGLGAWVDVYDYPLLPLHKTIAVLKKAGVQTLYMETGMSGTRQAVVPESVPWLVAAHKAGMKVVAWYLPYYVNVRSDVARTVWIARFKHNGIRFDGVGVDIEFKGAMGNNRIWNRNVVAHMNGVRHALGPDYPLAAIPPPPLQMRLAPETWQGFPWAQLGKVSSDIMLMSYWSFRTGCPQIALNCPYEFTKYNVEITRRAELTSDPLQLVGASIYDIGTTRPQWWRSLSRLRDLG